MAAQKPNTGLRLNESTGLVACVAIILFTFLGVAYSMKMDAIETLPYVMRPTAWLAFALFITAFTASSIRILYDMPYSRWAMRNRRYIGISFALVHFVHAGIVLSNLVFTEATRTAGELSGGGLAYLFLFLMAVTSNNASVRKMGAKNWKRLHKIGSYYIWLIFIGRSLPVALAEGITHAAIPTVCLLALALRIAARQKLKRRKP
ncbi:ferric reductase-like transmembrane domain-containing protein [Kordiimonas aquimaris]|uniref:ferric reductase-like transmembrane domain-containing protein n=1 Tax=Kordiimonas aquimaris TaxID=707591 RepID=UPI0021CFFA67|nr:ferric reductase-like transmembrane domain-containing protein [Kordiimonas aquimaris]